MNDRIRVVLADDHQLVRAGIRSLLGAFSGVEVVGEADEDVYKRQTKGCLQLADETVGVFAIARDISERKEAERRLRRLSGFFNAVAQTNQAIMHAESAGTLLVDACRIVVRHGDVDGAWICLLYTSRCV